MRTVSAREANQSFSQLLQSVEEGEEIVITRRGKPVARLTAIEDAARDTERQAGIARLIEHWREGIDLGGPVTCTRDEMYEP